MDSVDVPEGWMTILTALSERGVQYVIAEASAAAIVAGETPEGLVIAPAPYRRNLERLAQALGGLAPRVRGGDGHHFPLETDRLVQHPAMRWRLQVGGTALDVIGSAVGDGEFSIRVWRTRPATLAYGADRVTAEVERAEKVPTAV